MQLFTKTIEAQLLRNGENPGGHKPVVKIFNPYGNGTWLLSEMDDEGVCFGLCDLGMGSPELGYVERRELETYRNIMGWGFERDRYWKADRPLMAYAEEAWELGRIRA